MLQILDWLHALTSTHSIRVISSQRLINEIRHKQALRVRTPRRYGILPMKMNLSMVPIFNPERSIDLKPIRLLHSLGRITTPPIPNLAGLSSTWAIIRYIWAFDNNRRNNHLRLSHIARELDFHQKCLLSDEIGMGMAYYIMTNFFNTPKHRDASLALHDSTWNITQVSTSIPDFLFFDDPAKGVYVVECKGNQSGYSEMLDQMRRGTEQVPSIIFNDGRRSTAIVIATFMDDDATSVYIIDPINEKSDDEILEEYKKREKIVVNEWRIEDDKHFWMNSRLIDRAKILAFAGLESEALSQLPTEEQKYWEKYARKPVEIEKIETDFGVFSGVTEHYITAYNFNVSLYHGILDEYKERIVVKPHDTNERASKGSETIDVPDWYKTRFQENSFIEFTKESDKGISVQSICKDGTLMQIKVSR
jgi:hypothetical protein